MKRFDNIKQIQSKFRILKNWNIKQQKDDEYTGQVHCSWKERKAVICPWSTDINEKAPSDYILHEILHICMGEIIYNKKPYRKRRLEEELFVQDLCNLIMEGKI